MAMGIGLGASFASQLAFDHPERQRETAIDNKTHFKGPNPSSMNGEPCIERSLVGSLDGQSEVPMLLGLVSEFGLELSVPFPPTPEDDGNWRYDHGGDHTISHVRKPILVDFLSMIGHPCKSSSSIV